SLNSSGVVNINTSATSSGTLAGTGSVGAVTLAGINGTHKAVINPGATGAASVGTLTVASLTVNTGADLQFDFSGATSDVITDQGTLTLSGLATITPFGSAVANSYTVLTATSITGPVPTLVNSGETRLTFAYDPTSYNGTTGNSIVIKVSGSP